MKPDRSRYLEPSPYASDGGHDIGKDPRRISRQDLGALGAPTSPGKAIRAKCIDCSGGDASEVRKCTALECALWPYRMGRSPFHGRAKGIAPRRAPDAQIEALEIDDAPAGV